MMACDGNKYYPVVGVITEIHLNRHELTIHHDEIKNFMMAMTMNFKLKQNEDISQFSVGDSIHFRLSFEGNNGYATHFKVIEVTVVCKVFKTGFRSGDRISK